LKGESVEKRDHWPEGKENRKEGKTKSMKLLTQIMRNDGHLPPVRGMKKVAIEKL